MRKKIQFLLVTLILLGGLVGQLHFPAVPQPYWSAALGLAAYSLSAWVLRYGLNGVEFLTLLSLPALFTLSISAVLFLFPNFSFTFRFLLLTLYALSFYLMLLAENIFNVGRERPLPLLKAAQTVSFLLTLLTTFLLFTVVYKANLSPFLLWFLSAGLAFLLAFQSLWTVVLGNAFDRQVLFSSLLTALAQGQLTVALSFLPFESFFRALALTTGFYVFLGTVFRYLRKALTRKVFLEYGLVVGLVILVLLVI